MEPLSSLGSALLVIAGYVDLPAHAGTGGFDHADVCSGKGLMYVAHTANDAVDVIDLGPELHVRSIPKLRAVAGALVDERGGWVFTSNRGEDTVAIFPADDEGKLAKVPVGVRPNGLAFDPRRNLLLAANVGDPARPGSHTLSLVDTAARKMVASVPVAGRTRWAIFDPKSETFFVNIAEPAQIVLVQSARPDRIDRIYKVPATGPHGLGLDVERRMLFCACDAGTLVCLHADTGKIIAQVELSGAPDVIFFNPVRRQLYVAMGDPGVVDVIDTETMSRAGSVATEKGAHTMAFDAARQRLYVFLPQSHRAAIYKIRG